MRNTLKHLTLLTRMKDDGLLPALTGSFSEDAIEQACGQVETLQLQKRLHIRKTKRIQEELIRVPNFAALYGVLCRQEIGDEEIASVLESADGYGEKLTAYPQEQVLAVMKLELLPSLRFEYLKYYFPFVMYEEEEQVILDNLQTFPIAEWKGLSMLTEHQRDMMRQPFLGSYLFFWHQNERKALELLEQNRPLQRVCILLYRYGVRLFLSVERLKDLRWMKMTDVGKFRRLLAVFEYDAEDLSAFFDLWLDNHAGQYDLNWFISQPHPLSKERREEILCNQLSYLNALYAGRLHLDFNAVRQFQFSILIYAVEHRKKHFLELVDQNSEVFLSLGRYSLLFEPGFCEHCNINSLTLKNLKASDSVNRSDSFFTLLEEGQQYTFEEMYQLWHQKEVYVRLYTMLTPLSIDQRLLTLRQLIKRDLVSQYSIYIEDAACFPQAYAAAATMLHTLVEEPKAVILDIGGFTADYLLMKNGEIDLTSCDSLENGVILLYNKVRSKVNSELDLLLDEGDVDAILMGKKTQYPDAAIRLTEQMAQEFINDLFSTLRERMLDLQYCKVVFVGGGAILLKRQIETSGKVGTPFFVPKINANADGYEYLYRIETAGR